MLSLATALFAIAFVASGGREQAWRGAWAAWLAAAACLGSAIVGFGALRGMLVACTALLTAASVLVLILPAHPRRSAPLAWGAAVSGAACAALGLAGVT